MKFFSLLTTILFFIPALYSQTYSIGIRAGLCNIRGEVTNNLGENYGADLSLNYTFLFINSPWMFTSELSHSQAALKQNFNQDDDFRCSFGQSYLGAGFKFSLNPKISRRPRPGQFFPLLGFGFGVTQTTLSKLENPPPPGYETFSGTKFQAAMQLEFGAMVRINRELSFEGYFITRTSGSDDWDAIIGTGKRKDWLIRGGVGLTYAL